MPRVGVLYLGLLAAVGGKPLVSIDADGAAGPSKAAAYLDCWPPEEDLKGLCELAAQLCEAPVAAIDLIDDGRLYTVAAYGAPEEVRDAEGTLSAAAIAAGEDVYAEDVTEDPRLTATLTGIVMGIGEVLGGVFSPTLAGALGDAFGLQAVMWFLMALTLGGLVLSAMLTESAPEVRAKRGLAPLAA